MSIPPDPVILTPLQRAVLEAMTRQDPAPRIAIDSAADAVHRRMSGDVPSMQAVQQTLDELRNLHLVDAPLGNFSPAGGANTARWITPAGWWILNPKPKPEP